MSTKYYFHIHYDKRQEAKLQGAKWCPETKKWYTLDSLCPLLEKYQIIYLQVKYEDKEHAKSIGANYDPIMRQWFTTPQGNQLLINLYS
jgi:hypothetical protein